MFDQYEHEDGYFVYRSDHAIRTGSHYYDLPDALIRDLCDQTAQRSEIDLVYIEKDFHVSEMIRNSIYRSSRCPDTQTVIAGSACLSKTGLVQRHFESVDCAVLTADETFYVSEEHDSLIEEIVESTCERSDIEVFIESYWGSKLACAILEYQYLYPEQASVHEDKDLGRVKAKWEIKHHPPEQTETVSLCSYIGETAAINQPELLEEYPVLRPFDVLVSSPLFVLIEKLGALNWRSEVREVYGLRRRARDMLDVAVLLSDENVRATVNSETVNALHSDIMSNLSSDRQRERYGRPEGGFGCSPAFEPGKRGYEILEEAYPSLRSLVYNQEHWLEFGEALAVIRDSKDIL